MLDAAGASIPASVEGKSLMPLATGETTTGGYERIYCCESTWQSKWAVRTETEKLIVSRQPDHHFMPMRELYDLASDPQEEHNLVDAAPDRADALEAELDRWLAEGLRRVGRTEDPLTAQGITLGKRWDTWKP
jgi:arylsulfatase A-like enzyme